MKIVYLCYWDLAAGDGVARKVETQARLWRESGHEAEVVSIRPGRRRAETPAAVAAVERLRPDLVYLRYDLFLPPVWRLLRRRAAVIEVNADDRAETARRGVAARTYNRANRSRVFAAAVGAVCVTRELAEGLGRTDLPVAVVANGADPDSVPALPAPRNERPRLVFAGSPAMAWHGVDRLLDLARELPDVDVDLVGPIPGDAPDNVTVHGTLAGAAYWDVLSRADAAVGSLAMERAGLREGSPLKVREYLLAGIPTVIGYDDTDFPGDLPWYLARHDGPAGVRDFLARIRGRRAPRDELLPRLSWQAKEAARLAFLGRVRSGHGRVSETVTNV